MQECLVDQEIALQDWWEELPLHLKINTTSLPSLAPPSHIISLNTLYHTFKILLYRPMLSQRNSVAADDLEPIQNYLVECVTSATSILSIFDLFCRSFGIDQSSRTLSQVKRINPVIGSALTLITKELVSLGIDVDALGLTNAPTTPPMSSFGIPSALFGEVPLGPMSDTQTAHIPNPHHLPFLETFGTEGFHMNPDVFQTMSSLEPLSVRMGAIHE
ncbi:hypothetical protein HYQ44_008838 [Verticillium longisporum]|nr:hypothetical protein HYQ44_008838 [Verticillium longisporum]